MGIAWLSSVRVLLSKIKF